MYKKFSFETFENPAMSIMDIQYYKNLYDINKKDMPQKEFYLAMGDRVKVGDRVLILDNSTGDMSWVVTCDFHPYGGNDKLKKVLAINFPLIVMESQDKQLTKPLIVSVETHLIFVVEYARPVVGQYIVHRQTGSIGQIVSVSPNGKNVSMKDLSFNIVFDNRPFIQYNVVSEEFVWLAEKC